MILKHTAQVHVDEETGATQIHSTEWKPVKVKDPGGNEVTQLVAVGERTFHPAHPAHGAIVDALGLEAWEPPKPFNAGEVAQGVADAVKASGAAYIKLGSPPDATFDATLEWNEAALVTAVRLALERVV
jgi:hypothetical protein